MHGELACQPSQRRNFTNTYRKMVTLHVNYAVYIFIISESYEGQKMNLVFCATRVLVTPLQSTLKRRLNINFPVTLHTVSSFCICFS